ncbi:uncharacterized protein BXZ73DRAFT_82904 [Epithele typhae]|uniref:uncharacterized protein n=1 Tax=Epithele typhae TaxID=378194 RepID=UPI002008AE72|nr:uncharacterized protein BXZ73DRAFT_82904 [Epithele typhae]KAH9911280.1 hypothetical protein BXZ73DRAFT_82904 [Epithele typhae]
MSHTPDVEGQRGRNDADQHSSAGHNRSERHDAWNKAAKLFHKRDKEKIKAWQNETDGFLNFSSLFSAVITVFLAFTFPTIEPNNASQNSLLLQLYKNQLDPENPLSLPTNIANVFDSPPPTSAAILPNILLIVSLLFSLIASGKSLWFKEWLREYTLDEPRHPRSLLRIRQLRHDGLAAWHMHAIVSAISFLLQLSVALFATALVMVVQPIPSPPLRIMVTTIAALWVTVTLAAAVCPTLSAHCPFKSALAGWVFRLLYATRTVLYPRTPAGCARSSPPGVQTGSGSQWECRYKTFGEREHAVAEALGELLDLEALEYLNEEYWGHKDLRVVNRCFRDIAETPWALERIEKILAVRLHCAERDLGLESVVKDRWLSVDTPGVKDLMRIWLDIDKQHPSGRGEVKEVFGKALSPDFAAVDAATLFGREDSSSDSEHEK